uniref:General transcription factor IIF subunit 2 n=1 Tax=Rousettus aegyptiacus TaxID=9407 RepID=A0A7J8DWN9_ROUAE|nr:general transcription factor IIF subunit 2 [Rousettus aegyptiacus]
MLFSAFEKHQYYNLKDLVDITKQPVFIEPEKGAAWRTEPRCPGFSPGVSLTTLPLLYSVRHMDTSVDKQGKSFSDNRDPILVKKIKADFFPSQAAFSFSPY